jgi:hypothetical protein
MTDLPKSEFDEASNQAPADELWIDRYLLPAIRESTLFPLLLVVIGHVVAFIAPALLFAVRDRSFGAMLALVVIAFFTVQCIRFEVRRHGRPDVLSAIFVGTWLASAATAWACDHYHLL